MAECLEQGKGSGRKLWSKGMPSPNPNGRPIGIIDKRHRVTKALMDDAPEVARVVVQQALAGDIQAAGLVLARVAPPIKQQAEKVEFELSTDLPFGAQANQILAAVAAGKVDPETGRILIGCLQAVAQIKAVEDLEGRIITLEARQL